MLCIRRKEGQEIWIGDKIRVVVTQVAGSHVSLGIDAPRELRVTRDTPPEPELTKVHEGK